MEDKKDKDDKVKSTIGNIRIASIENHQIETASITDELKRNFLKSKRIETGAIAS